MGEVFLLTWEEKASMDGTVETIIERAAERKVADEVMVVVTSSLILIFCFEASLMCSFDDAAR